MSDKPLPPNWEAKIDAQSGRTYYLNHETKSSQWEDPRMMSSQPPPMAYGQPQAQPPMGAMTSQPQGQPMMMQSPGMVAQTPGMIVNAPIVAQMPSGCPPGLEHLAFLDNLYIKQKVEMLEVFTGWSTENKYHILNPAMQQIFYCKEDSHFCSRMCLGPLRPMVLNVTDNSGRQVLAMDRPYSCASPWVPFCLPVNFCFLQKMTVMSPLTGEVFGTVKQNWELCAASFNLEDVSGNLIGVMHAPLCICNCGNDIDFPVEKNGQSMALVAHKWGGFLKEVYTNADDYHVTFPLDMPVQHKAVIVGAALLIDFIFFENKQNNNDS